MNATLLVAHGSRDPIALREIGTFADAYRARHPGAAELAFIELARPSLAEGLAALAQRASTVAVAPLFLFTARHVKNDLPLALEAARRASPGVRFVSAQAFGVHPQLVDLAFTRAVASGLVEEDARARTAVILLGRGSSDPDANADFCKLTRLFSEGRGFAHVQPAFIGVTRPTLEDALEMAARARPERILVVPYLLFSGILLTKIRDKVQQFGARYPWIRLATAPHLADGALDAILDHVDRRVDEAIQGSAPLPCDTCQYRVPLAGLQENVGGLKALLWSVRHAVTHTQAAPHPHAHRALVKHVLVCGNADCASRGSVALLEVLRRELAAAGKEREVRVTRTGCMGRCGEGPTVAVYPDGIWYRGVLESDAVELCREHLIHDRILARLVDQIMQ
jgi:sirohydrochlorin ferrochelatase/(2Fe-2S) ferredoxin